MNSLSPHYLAREQTIKNIRAFFDGQGFHEVITPVLARAVPTEPNVHPFSTEWNTRDGKQTLWLSTSPEKNLKKMLGMGLGNCYSIGHCFRNLEASGHRHQPEFLMLEWYRTIATYHDVMKDTQYLCERILATKSDEWPKISLRDVFREHLHIQLDDLLEDDAMTAFAKQHGYETHGASWGQLFDQLVLNEIEPHFAQTPFFLVDFPARISPLCASHSALAGYAERFELMIAGVEVANGNTESIDADAVRAAFSKEEQSRNEQGLPVSPLDVEFLASLEKLKQSQLRFAGVGLGVDRLAMLLTQANEINDVTLFFS